MLSDGCDAPAGDGHDTFPAGEVGSAQGSAPAGGQPGIPGGLQDVARGLAAGPGHAMNNPPIEPGLSWMPPLAPAIVQAQAQALMSEPLPSATPGAWPAAGATPAPALLPSQTQTMTSAAPDAARTAEAAADARANAPLELEVIHETTYRYRSPVELAHHIAVLRPRDDPGQQLLSFELHIDPPPSRQRSEPDLYGNTRTLFSLTAAHEALSVRACSRVRVWPSTPVRPAPAWEICQAAWRYESGQAFDPATEFVFPSPMIPNSRALRDWALPSFKPGRPLDLAAIDLMHRLHAEFRYEPLSTHVDTPLLEAFEQRRGVCQDFAHIMIGALRSLGLAARYVSGYLLTEPPPGQPRLQGADASHAWVAVAWPAPGTADGAAGAAGDIGIAGTQWLELDPTNDCLACTGHVRLAYGRDYGDVTPLRGVIRGGGRHRLGVNVSTRIV